MSDLFLEIRLDRLDRTYRVGQTVSGFLYVNNPGKSTVDHGGLRLLVEGSLKTRQSVRQHNSPFDHLISEGKLKNVQLLNFPLDIAKGGDKELYLPPGETEIPFSFILSPNRLSVPLKETYNGVYISVSYVIHFQCLPNFAKRVPNPVKACPFLVIVPGQGKPQMSKLTADNGIDFVLKTGEGIQERSYNAIEGKPGVPDVEIVGHIDRYYNSIDIPLSGHICVKKCSVDILSLDIQFLRVEFCATSEFNGKEQSEIQSIQTADGDVLRGVDLPIHMMFPRWYTCPSIVTDFLRVEFEVNFVIVVEGYNQFVKNIPLKIYRGDS